MAVAWFFRPFLLFSSFLVLSPLTTFSVSDSEALLKLKKSFTNASAALDSWVPSSAPCDKQVPWDGLLCDKGIVTGLRLEGMGLSGNIDVDALVVMKGLRSFSVMNNSFTGKIPEINRLGGLKALFLSGNQFSGEIPPKYFANMESLKKVWLSNNKFIGNIPISLAQLSRLIDLHVENNGFSGHIPAFNLPTLRFINFSNNKLEGEIPSSLSKFNAKLFAGNPGLCGEMLGVECNKDFEASPAPTPIPKNNTGRDKNDYKKIIAAIITLGIVLLSMVLFIAIRWRKKKQRDGNALGRGIDNDAVEVHVSVPTRREEEVGGKGANTARRATGHGKPSGGAVPELVMVNDEKGVFGLPDLMKAAAEVLGNGPLGSSYKAKMANGVVVVVKRMREMNELGKDAFDAEVKRLGKLRHPNILTPLAYLYRREEKLFISEYLPEGSLLYQLHGDHGTSGVVLDWPARVKIVKGIAEGLDYLHTELASLDVPHGNLKSSNVLLGPDNHPYLSDFGFCPLVSIEGLEALFASKTPEAIHGTISPNSDVYCLGMLIFEILTGKFPSQYLSNGKGGTDIVQCVTSAFSEGRQAELLDPEITSSCQNSFGSVEQLLHIGLLCTQSSPEQRINMEEAVRLIEEIQVEGGLEPQPQDITIQDDSADAPNSN